MKKLLVYLKDYKLESVLGPLFKLLEASFELIVPLVMASIINVGIAHGDKPYIVKMFFVLIALAAIGLTCSITAQYFAAKAAVGFSTKLRYALFKHIQSLSFSEMDTVGTSTLITRMTSDINQVQSGINLVLRLFLRSPFIVFGAMIMAFTVDVKAALVFVVTIPLLSIVVFGVMVVSIPLFKKVQSALDNVLGRTRENLEGARVIRAFNKENDETEQFNDCNSLLTNMQIVVGRISAIMNPATYIIINFSIIAVIWLGGNQVNDGVILQGDVVALVSYMSQILIELIKLANLIVNINKSLACGNRIAEVMELEPSIKDLSDTSEHTKTTLQTSKTMQANITAGSQTQEPSATSAICFDHVCMNYAGSSEESLTDINFTAMKGQTIGIIGGTGSGKSSVVHLIPRFYDVSKGAVTVDGVNVKDYSLNELRGKVGIVMQKAVLFHGTIRDNLKWGNENATDEEIYHALEIAQALDVVKSKKDGLDYMIEQDGRNLSGGQRQRLTIARAVVKNPDILILDDSASALDFATDAKLRAALRTLQKGMTIVIVSQRTSSIQFADQILVLDDGNEVGLGTHEELLETCDTYKEIYESQFKKEDLVG